MAQVIASLSRHIEEKQQSICLYFKDCVCSWCFWTFRLMDLPPEARVLIYNHLFANTVFELSPTSVPSLHCQCSPFRTWSPGNFPPILRVSRAIREEALPVFFSLASVAFGQSTRPDPAIFSLPTYEILRRATVASLEPSFNTAFIQDPTPLLPSLQEVRMRLCPATVGQCLWLDVDLSKTIDDSEIIQRILRSFFSSPASTHVCHLMRGRSTPLKIVLEAVFVDLGERPSDEWRDMLVEVDLVTSTVIKRHPIRQADLNHWGCRTRLRWWGVGNSPQIGRAGLSINAQGKTPQQVSWQALLDMA